MQNIRLVLILVCAIFIWEGCNVVKDIPPDVQVTLIASGENRGELEKVIAHYSNKTDSLKLAAAYFLVRNMQHHYWLKGPSLDGFNGIFGQIEEYEKRNAFKGNYHFPIIHAWADSIIGIYGVPQQARLEKVYDHRTLTANLLIENIDRAFESWKFPWAKHLSFEEFCNYILPYRFQDESLESWRSLYMEKFRWIVDSMNGSTDPVKACKFINDDIKKWFRFSDEFFAYPCAISPLNLLKGKMGRCLDQAGIANFAMRAMGIPVVHEIIPQWGDRSMGHDFSSVLAHDGTFIGFLGGELPPGENEIRNKAPKIFRQMYPVQREVLLSYDDGLSFMLGKPMGKDVSSEFINTTSIELPRSVSLSNEIFLAVFNDREWVPICLAKNSSDKFIFENMGREIMYLPVTFQNTSLVPVADPLYVDSLGKIHMVNSSKAEKETIRLERKYPLSKLKRWWMTLMGKGKFEGANEPDFRNATTLFIIPDTISLKYHISEVKKPDKFRYVRYLFPDSTFGSLGELAFYQHIDSVPLIGQPIKSSVIKNEDLQIAFDGKMNKFIHTTQPGDYYKQWIGLDFGKQQLINYVGYSPRNDQNNVEKLMVYELFYWNNEWVSIGKTTATTDYLIYNNVPAGALLLLKNLTAGKEERIFFYENGRQLWF